MNSSSAPLINQLFPGFGPGGAQTAFASPPPQLIPNEQIGIGGGGGGGILFPPPSSVDASASGAGFFPFYDTGGANTMPWNGGGAFPNLPVDAAASSLPGDNLQPPLQPPPPPPLPFFLFPNDDSPEMKAAILWQNVAINFDYW